MTSPQPPRPQTGVSAGAALNEETLHLPITTPGPAAGARPTAPSPYLPRPAFRPAPPPDPAGVPQQAARPLPLPTERWEGMGFRPDIQGMRAIAVVLVLLSHAGFSFAAGGYVGVDVFFVLSGFLITSLLVKEVFDTRKISIAGFYARRARRILPAASAVTIATVVGAWLWFPITRFEAVMQDAFTVIVYVVNYRFIAEQTEYLNADQMPSPFQQYWSLAVEEQFYVVWPLLLLGLLLLVKRSPRKLVTAGIVFSVVIFAISLVLSVLITEQSQPTAYYAAHTRAWELAAGAFLALTLPSLKKTPKALAWCLGLAGLAAIVASGVLYTEATPFPSYTAMLPVLGTMMLIIAGSGVGKNPTTSLLGTGPLQFVGKISYSLYLWHWPILILAPLALDVEPSLLLNVILLAGTFAVAQLSYQYIEEPVRNARFIKSSNVWGLATGVLCSLLGIAMILTLTLAFSKTPEDQGPVDLEAVEEAEDDSVVLQNLEAAMDITVAPDDLQPSLTSVGEDEPRIYGDECHLGFSEVEPPAECVYGDTESETTIVLMGDSHAAQWFPALQAIAEERGWKLLPRTKSACTPVDVPVDNATLEREYTECSEWRQNVFDEIEELRPAMLVIGGSDAAPISGVGESGGLQVWRDGWASTLSSVPDGTQVAALTDTPWSMTSDSAPDCVALHLDAVQECNGLYQVEFADRREAGVAVQQAAGVTVIDTSAWFCLDGTCPVIVGDVLVYRDRHHMSTPYSRTLTDVLGAALPQL